MCHVAAKVLADDDVPGWAVSAVELLLDLRGDVLLDVVLFEEVVGGCWRSGSCQNATGVFFGAEITHRSGGRC